MSKIGWVCVIGLLLTGLAIVIANSPNSYLHAVFSGRCFASDAPGFCFRITRRGTY